MSGEYTNIQSRRRVPKSGPAKDMVECRRLKRGRAQEGASPLS